MPLLSQPFCGKEYATKPLTSLDDWNRAHAVDPKPRLQPNGIACPTCGGELGDVILAGGMRILYTTYPGQVDVACPCGYKGMRVA